jgi:hypothetical protein
LSLGFNSRFFAFAYQFDRLEDQVGTSGIIHAHTYRIALWGANAGRIGAGTAASLYRGGTGTGTSWDVGVVYRLHPVIDLGLVGANLIGHPTVRGTKLNTLLRPALTLHLGGLVAVQTQGEWGTASGDGWRGYALGTQLRVGGRRAIQINARLDTDKDLRRQAFTFGLMIGGENRGGAFFTSSGDLKDAEALSFHGVSERSRGSGRRR